MKLTNRAKNSLQKVLNRLETTREFINNDKTYICREGGNANLGYKNKDGHEIHTIHKQAGSHLVGIDRTINDLKAIIENGKI